MSVWQVIQGDCLDVMAEMDDDSIDAVVTDPPYGLAFMGKRWDRGVPGVEYWRECLRLLKPGGHLISFGGTRTYHRMACAVEDAGFDVRDQVLWIYGTGFPKSADVSKAIDKAAGAEREPGTPGPYVANRSQKTTEYAYGKGTGSPSSALVTEPVTEDAQKWKGWGTGLKPAHEPMVLARKPFTGTVADNVVENGTGAINVDGCRVPLEPGFTRHKAITPKIQHSDNHYFRPGFRSDRHDKTDRHTESPLHHKNGRWPANVCHDGGVSPYFYCAKATKTDREEGLRDGGVGALRDGGRSAKRKNHHPTVKPTSLMQWLVRLVTPPGGLVLDPFCGSGSTGKAAVLEGFCFIGIEREAEYVEIARQRIAWAENDVAQMEIAE